MSNNMNFSSNQNSNKVTEILNSIEEGVDFNKRRFKQYKNQERAKSINDHRRNAHRIKGYY